VIAKHPHIDLARRPVLPSTDANSEFPSRLAKIKQLRSLMTDRMESAGCLTETTCRATGRKPIHLHSPFLPNKINSFPPRLAFCVDNRNRKRLIEEGHRHLSWVF
jgi:hypothetical protein